jgi:hypothetical protein
MAGGFGDRTRLKSGIGLWMEAGCGPKGSWEAKKKVPPPPGQVVRGATVGPWKAAIWPLRGFPPIWPDPPLLCQDGAAGVQSTDTAGHAGCARRLFALRLGRDGLVGNNDRPIEGRQEICKRT